MSGFIAGVIGLTLLHVAVTNAGKTSAVISVPAGLLARWLDPTVPLIPDLRTN